MPLAPQQSSPLLSCHQHHSNIHSYCHAISTTAIFTVFVIPSTPQQSSPFLSCHQHHSSLHRYCHAINTTAIFTVTVMPSTPQQSSPLLSCHQHHSDLRRYCHAIKTTANLLGYRHVFNSTAVFTATVIIIHLTLQQSLVFPVPVDCHRQSDCTWWQEYRFGFVFGCLFCFSFLLYVCVLSLLGQSHVYAY